MQMGKENRPGKHSLLSDKRSRVRRRPQTMQILQAVKNESPRNAEALI